MTKPEIYLKIIGTPLDRITDTFLIMLPEGTGDELNKILTVKGVSNRERLEIVKQAGLTISEDSSSKFSKLFAF